MSSPALPVDIAFLRDTVSAGRLARAAEIAARDGDLAHEVLIHRGDIARETYLRRLADHLGLPFHDLAGAEIDPAYRAPAIDGTAPRAGALVAILPGLGRRAVLAPRGAAVLKLLRAPPPSVEDRPRPVVTTPARLWRFALACDPGASVANALGGLDARMPGASARDVHPVSRAGLAIGMCLFAVAAIMAPVEALSALALLSSSLFLLAAALRLEALATSGPDPAPPPPSAPPGIATILVPLAREAAVVPQLLAALDRIEGRARDKDVVLLLEADDRETIASVRRADPGERFLTLVLPPGGPRTKPRALCFGLAAARGALLVVYDAEDEPAPDQIARAAARFAMAPPRLACLQARLAIHDHGRGFLARQFALEYAGLFRVLLPGLARERRPIPLGGTSNVFRTAALRDVGGWDPWNVTEDADLGFRLARAGYLTETLASDTLEEAPPTFGAWLAQRTRWLKGWMATLVVLARPPAPGAGPVDRAVALGAAGTVGATLIGAFIYPLVPVVLLGTALHGLSREAGAFDAILFGVGSAAFVGGHLFSLATLWQGATLAGLNPTWRDIAGVPVYWALTSIAAWRALFAFVVDPWRWAKTTHVGRARAVGPTPDAIPVPGE